MKWWLVLMLVAGTVDERALFESLGARDLPARGWLSVPEARSRAAEEAARLKLARATGRADPRAEGHLRALLAAIERRGATTGAPPAQPAPAPAPRPLFGSRSVRVLVCKYRGGLEPCYHRAGCAHLRGIVTAVELSDARRTCAPCPACRGARGP